MKDNKQKTLSTIIKIVIAVASAILGVIGGATAAHLNTVGSAIF